MDDGKTIGTRGSEEGIIVWDEEFWNEEYEPNMRITLEREGSIAPWAVTCGIYGAFFHTAWASSESKGKSEYATIKAELEQIMALLQRGERNVSFEKMEHLRDTH